MRYVDIIKLDGIFGNNVLETVLKIQRHPGENRRQWESKDPGKNIMHGKNDFWFQLQKLLKILESISPIIIVSEL